MNSPYFVNILPPSAVGIPHPNQQHHRLVGRQHGILYHRAAPSSPSVGVSVLLKTPQIDSEHLRLTIREANHL